MFIHIEKAVTETQRLSLRSLKDIMKKHSS